MTIVKTQPRNAAEASSERKPPLGRLKGGKTGLCNERERRKKTKNKKKEERERLL